MVGRMRKVIVGLLLVMATGLTACSAEEMLSEIPRTVQLELPDISDGKELERESVVQDAEDGERVVSEAIFLSEFAYPYSYGCLSEAEKLWYKDIESALGSMEPEINLSEEGLAAGLDEKCIDTVFQCVLNDHPELFFVNGYTYTKYTKGNETVAISFSGTYEMTKEDALVRKQEIEQAVNGILSGIDMQATEYDKVKYVYDYIIRNTDYDLKASDNQNIYSVFVGKRSVCQGYAKAAQYLLNHMGVECTLVQGKVHTGEGHAWNLVNVDGSFYYMDVTWGDASYQMGDVDLSNQQLPEISYDYLCITTKQLLATHIPENCVPLPECVAEAANYYVRQGALFTFYDKAQMSTLFARTLGTGGTDVTIKCADNECFQEIRTALIENQEIFEYLPVEQVGNSSVAYASNDKQLSLTFWMTNQ